MAMPSRAVYRNFGKVGGGGGGGGGIWGTYKRGGVKLIMRYYTLYLLGEGGRE